MIGRRCTHSNVFSRPVLIARNLSFKPNLESLSSKILRWLIKRGEDPPLPIPNREVKLTSADGTAPPGGRVGSCRFSKSPTEKSAGLFFLVRPARTYSNGCKSPDRPDSGKVTAKGKGVHREVESKGSRRQKVGPMNKNLVQGWKAGAMLPEKYKPDNYPNCRQ